MAVEAADIEQDAADIAAELVADIGSGLEVDDIEELADCPGSVQNRRK